MFLNTVISYKPSIAVFIAFIKRKKKNTPQQQSQKISIHAY